MTRAPWRFEISTVRSSLNESTTRISSLHDTESSHREIFVSYWRFRRTRELFWPRPPLKGGALFQRKFTPVSRRQSKFCQFLLLPAADRRRVPTRKPSASVRQYEA